MPLVQNIGGAVSMQLLRNQLADQEAELTEAIQQVAASQASPEAQSQNRQPGAPGGVDENM